MKSFFEMKDIFPIRLKNARKMRALYFLFGFYY